MERGHNLNIPSELRERPQWLVCDYSKIPHGRDGRKADPTDPATWMTFEEARAAPFPLVGFVLSKTDPYTVIDLDKPKTEITPDNWAKIRASHTNLVESIPSYCEISTNGEGFHIWVKAVIPAGRKREGVEIYDDKRFMIVTGNVYKDAPITEQQSAASKLYVKLSQGLAADPNFKYESMPSGLDDDDVFEMALNAANSDKFNDLCNGNWQFYDYISQSEADQALLTMIAYYTPDDDQVKRIFRDTQLAKHDTIRNKPRSKVHENDRYLDKSLRKVRQAQLNEGVLQALQDEAKAVLEQRFRKPEPAPADHVAPATHYQVTAPSPASPMPGFQYPFPPGAIGYIAEYAYRSAVRQVPQMALTAGIGFMAGLCGRSYNVSSTGLNQYMCLLAQTGRGKDHISWTIETITRGIEAKIPMVSNCIGGANFSSASALYKFIADKPCFVSIQGEFGKLVHLMCHKKANDHARSLQRVYLDLYNKSGWGQVLRPQVYADKDKTTRIVRAPCLTLLGETTQTAFEEALKATGNDAIADGFLPRFLMIEYDGIQPYENELTKFVPPDQQLIDYLAAIAETAIAVTNNDQVCHVQHDPTAWAMQRDFSRYATDMVNANGANGIIDNLWNRANLKAMKLAALIAVGVNHHNPVIDQTAMQYAIDFVQNDVHVLMRRYNTGAMQSIENEQEDILRTVLKDYLSMTYPNVPKGFKVSAEIFNDKVITHEAFRVKVRKQKAFADARNGQSRALKERLNVLVESGELVPIKPDQALKRYGVRAQLYQITAEFS